jgi:uncharacterized membrane protein
MSAKIPLDVWIAAALSVFVVGAAIFELPPAVFFAAYGVVSAAVACQILRDPE